MKKILLLSVAVFMLSVNAFALSWNPQPSSSHLVGVSVGYLGKSMRVSNSSASQTTGLTAFDDSKLSNSIQFGVSLTPEFLYGIGLQTGVYYEWTWDNAMNPYGVGKIEQSANNHEISIPLRFQWRYEIIDGISVYAFTGPSFDFGLVYSMRAKNFDAAGNLEGKSYWNQYSGKYNISSGLTAWGGSISMGEGKNDNMKMYKNFHPYWGFGVGFQWEYLRLQVTSDWGIMNVSNNTYSDVYFNKPISVSLSYLF